ncbi:AMP-binding protein [Vibrio neonatus]|uniref:AMP-binding protein n=1 Tax=Vibrio neonatus TaxID=278860 RepID=UPI0021C263B0|nr:AMP-binding protein [Vibrio neonatus]
MNLEQASFSSLTHLFCTERATNNRASNNIVAFDQHTHITWHEFQHDVALYAERLAQHREQNVALCFGNSYLFAVGFFAACYSQKSLVLPGNYQTQALKELSQHFDLLLHDNDVTVSDDLNALEVTRSIESTAAKPITFAPLDLDSIKVTLFTSGSSGAAKAIEKKLSQLDNEVAILESLWGADIANTRIESTVSHLHIYGLLFRLLWPLCAGRPFAVHNLEFPEQVIQHADKDSVLISSPALLKRLTAEQKSAPYRRIVSSGGPLPETAAKLSQALLGSLPMEVFGSTETGGIAFRQQHTPSTAWQLFPTVEAELNSENCLRLRAPHIAGDDWYQTADECQFRDQRSFDLKGRTDRVIKIEEKRISLVELEKRLDQLDWIEESATIPMQDDQRLTICAVIVLTDVGRKEVQRLGKGPFWIALRKALRDWLEPVAIPRKYRIVDEIPLNSQGKRQVNEIKKLFQA